ncbi:putative uncharacterized protein precursor [Sphingobium chlorophenolicum]|uniref:Uncharacterized protein n=2 Tax=Sphingobium chlorophenolicum TaxID=46429 RepID=A0A081R8V8_SPHCR|nr:hypothetical protein [Sphingobium chlorophenolicum]KEQ51631.1 putative uncharacterized protein precursor [Sphingobium chlorophenolicum]
MSARFWLFSLACAGMAMTGGYGLGLYATTTPRAAMGTPLPEAVMPEDADYDPAALTGPAVIHCEGCGPTLADRQMAADMAGWDGAQDPAWRDYAAREDEGQAEFAPPSPPASLLPASEEREESFQPVRIAEAPNGKTPAGEAPADAAIAY